MKEFWSGRVRDMTPYVPGEQPKNRKFIKLNTNENPYPPSPRVGQAVADAAADLRLYPDPECVELRQAVAKQVGLSPENVFCGNGSDEVLSFAFQAFFDKGKAITMPDITYSFYEIFVKYLDLTVELVPLNEDFSLPVEKFFRCPGGVVVANPNAPTGQSISPEKLEEVLASNEKNVVLVDEAYVDFGAKTAAGLIPRYPNLLVVQTASKSRSLAGLRVGWALGQPNLMAALRCVRDSINSYTVDRLASAAAVAALGDGAYFEKTRRAIMETRERTWLRLGEMGFEGAPSQANFLFVRHPRVPGKVLYDGLHRRGVLTRRWDAPRIKDFLRVSIGTPEEMDALCAALADAVAEFLSQE